MALPNKFGDVAPMMQEFEIASSTNYKRSLQYLFDRVMAISQLRNEKAELKLHATTRLLNQVYFIRKFDINWNEFTDIDDSFLQSAQDSLMSSNEESECDDVSTAYLFSLAMKYLYRNSRDTVNPANLWSLRELLDLVATLIDIAIKTELVWTLGFMLASMSPSSSNEEILDNKLCNDINTVILSNSKIGEEPKAFLLDKFNAVKCEHNKIQPNNFILG